MGQKYEGHQCHITVSRDKIYNYGEVSTKKAGNTKTKMLFNGVIFHEKAKSMTVDVNFFA